MTAIAPPYGLGETETVEFKPANPAPDPAGTRALGGPKNRRANSALALRARTWYNFSHVRRPGPPFPSIPQKRGAAEPQT